MTHLSMEDEMLDAPTFPHEYGRFTADEGADDHSLQSQRVVGGVA